MTRSGARPAVHRFTSRSDHDTALVARIEQSLRLVGAGHGDFGVLAATNPQADKVIALLRTAGIPTVALTVNAGKSSDEVRVGTIKRAKGLEFKQVLLPHVRAALLAGAPPTESVADRERRDLDRREL